MKIYPNKLYLINEGETLKFNETSRTSRVYLAVGGGFKLENGFIQHLQILMWKLVVLREESLRKVMK